MNYLLKVVEDEMKLLKNKNHKTSPLKVNSPIKVKKSSKTKSNHSMTTRQKYNYINVDNQTYKNIINNKMNTNKMIARQNIINNSLYVDYQTYRNFISK